VGRLSHLFFVWAQYWLRRIRSFFTMSHQGQFPLSNRDVISVVVCPQAPNQLYSGQTHRFQDLLSKLAATIGVQSSYLTESEMLGLMQSGIPCELLQPGMDWQAGRLKLTLSFEAAAVVSAAPTEGVSEIAPQASGINVAAPMAVAAAIALPAIPAMAMPEAEIDNFDQDDFTVSIDPMAEADSAMDLDFGEADLDLDAVEESTFVRVPAAAELAQEDEMVAAALDDMGGLDHPLGSIGSELDAGFGDMPSLADTSFGEGNSFDPDSFGTDSDLAGLNSDLFEAELGEPELIQAAAAAADFSDLEDELGFGDLDQPDYGTMVEVARETNGVPVDAMALPDLDASLDSGFNFDSESDAIEAGMNAALGFEDDLEMPSLGDAPAESLGSLDDAFDFGDDDLLNVPGMDAAGLSLDSDFDLDMDLGNLAMDAAKMDVLDPASSATLTPDKPSKPVDTDSLDVLGFDALDNPWDLSDDLDAMLLSNGPLS
jgi:hypothetical protein